MTQRRHGRAGTKLLKLWMLQPLPRFFDLEKSRSVDDNKAYTWNPWYCTHRVTIRQLVRAYTEEEARAYAQAHAGFETSRDFLPDDFEIWKSPIYISCEEVMKFGRLGSIMIESTTE